MKKNPAFCPNEKCMQHHRKKEEIQGKSKKMKKKDRWFHQKGLYRTRIFGIVQRYRCKNCGRNFSDQTYSINYYAKKRISYRRIEEELRCTSGIRDIARNLRIHNSTVLNRISRLSRNAIAVHSKILNSMNLEESLVADGFETFIVSQYHPCHFTLLVGKESQFIYSLNYTLLRRKGSMTDIQKYRRELLEKKEKADPKGVEKAFSRVLDTAFRLFDSNGSKILTLFTDEHPAYVRAINKNKKVFNLRLENRFQHKRISSKKVRTVINPLFSVNYVDRQIRKDRKDHVRETVCFARNVNNAMERLIVYRFYHNYRKPFRENRKKGDISKHCTIAGIDQKKVSEAMAGFYSSRAFFSREKIHSDDRVLWLRQLKTPLQKERPGLLPKFAAEDEDIALGACG